MENLIETAAAPAQQMKLCRALCNGFGIGIVGVVEQFVDQSCAESHDHQTGNKEKQRIAQGKAGF